MESITKAEILQCRKAVAKSPGWQKRIVRDYEFDLYFDGEREMYLDEARYKIIDGSLIFRKPGQVIHANGDYNAYMLTLDFSGKNIENDSIYKRSSSTVQQEVCTLDILEKIPEMFFPYHKNELISLYKKLCDCSVPGIEDRELQKKYLPELLFLIFSDALRFIREADEKKGESEKYTDSACDFIQNNYQRNISVDDVAHSVNLSKNYLIRLFKKELSTTPNRYILETRLYHSRLLLTQTRESVKNIGLSCGFATPSYFIKCYRERFGETPLEYRAKLGDIQNI